MLMSAASLTGADSLAFRVYAQRRETQALVVAMHETPASSEAQLRRQLEFAAEHFTITTFEHFARWWRTPDLASVSKPLLLFTFDDGRESNYTIAAPLLESFGGRGVFFVVPAFAERAGSDQAFEFYRTKINPDAESTHEQSEDWKPMSVRQIADLAARGHTIGNHSLTHARLAGLPTEVLEQEIGDSAALLASWVGGAVDAFAWTFGWDAIDTNGWRAIRQHHRFCFSPCAGVVDVRRDDPSLIWRRELEVRYSEPEYRFCYSGLVDLFWGSRRERLRRMIRTPDISTAK
jgi:peptidoglycan/xylan/chitin deacetylase (PgdA/CDA1 family)